MPEDPEPAIDLNDARGGYHFPIAVEGPQQELLRRAFGERLAAGEQVVVPCKIHAEPSNRDSNCLAVYIDGFGLVAHFERQDSEEWRKVRAELAWGCPDGWCWGHLHGGGASGIGLQLNLMGARGALVRVRAAKDPKYGRRSRAREPSA